MKKIKIGPVTLTFGDNQIITDQLNIERPFHANCKASQQEENNEEKTTMYFCTVDGNRLREITTVIGYNAQTGKEKKSTEYVCPLCKRVLQFNFLNFNEPFSMVKNSKTKK